MAIYLNIDLQCVREKNQNYFLHNRNTFALIAIIFGNIAHVLEDC